MERLQRMASHSADDKEFADHWRSISKSLDLFQTKVTISLTSITLNLAQAPIFTEGAQLRDFVESQGGWEAVKGDSSKREELVRKFNIDSQYIANELGAVTSTLKNMQQENQANFRVLQTQQQAGPYTYIQHEQIRETLWKTHLSPQNENISLDVFIRFFCEVFAKELSEVDHSEFKEKLRLEIDQDGNGMVNVTEADATFPPGNSIQQCIRYSNHSPIRKS
ncbi:hypothetical protein CYMTET_23348 [Cymbomonas tetramitiformis]|uniref:EF-hand domain-containing protein n=1 Tax=Cymbomonas tetramitiformis TaxID=36881 RepID=A0AAE0L1A7_9CHLO|nr:hypothetical protein CYMTET_23348 [Cymbomonas tetramitiformis]